RASLRDRDDGVEEVRARCAARFTLRSARKLKSARQKKFFSLPAARQCCSAKTCCAVGNPAAQRARYCRVGTAHLRTDGGQCPPYASSLTSRIVSKIGHAPKCPE